MKKPKSERKKLVDKLDRVFSEYIRKRDGYRCIVCGATRESTVIQCGHLFSRVSHSARFDELNASAQCMGCNLRHEFDFEPYRRAWLAKHSQDEYDSLYARWSQSTKFTNSDLQYLIIHYQDKLEALDD